MAQKDSNLGPADYDSAARLIPPAVKNCVASTSSRPLSLIRKSQFLHQPDRSRSGSPQCAAVGRPRHHGFAQIHDIGLRIVFHTDKEIGISLSVFRTDILFIMVIGRSKLFCYTKMIYFTAYDG